MKRWKINTIDEFKRCIDCDLSEIEKPGVADKYYGNAFYIPKKNGRRKICAVDKMNPLYNVQKNLKRFFLDNIFLSDRAYGYVKEQNYFDFLNEHTRDYRESFYLRIDIKGFFDSIKERHIESAFDFYVEGEDKKLILNYIKEIVLYKGKLVQGTPVAPAISNIVFRPLDIRIERYCDACGVRYSRYVDDLLFSSEKEGALNRRFVKTISRILNSMNFDINYDKMKFSRGGIALNGFVIGQDVRLSRRKLKHISGMVYYLEQNPIKKEKKWFENFNKQMSVLGYDLFGGCDDIVNALAGNRSFLILAIRYASDAYYLERCRKIIERIEKQILLVYKADYLLLTETIDKLAYGGSRDIR